MTQFDVEQLIHETPESEPLWRALAKGQLELQQCSVCGGFRFPPLADCPFCSAVGGDWKPVEARGTIYSWVITHLAFDEDFATEVPYIIGTIDLDAGPRLFARLTDVAADQLRAGLAVVGYVADERGLPFLRFRPENERP
jgi:hypothetical protein